MLNSALEFIYTTLLENSPGQETTKIKQDQWFLKHERRRQRTPPKNNTPGEPPRFSSPEDMTNMFDHARTNKTARTPGYKWALAHILPKTLVSQWEKVPPARDPEQCVLLWFFSKTIWGSEFGRAITFAIKTNFRASQQNELRIKGQTKC